MQRRADNGNFKLLIWLGTWIARRIVVSQQTKTEVLKVIINHSTSICGNWFNQLNRELAEAFNGSHVLSEDLRDLLAI